MAVAHDEPSQRARLMKIIAENHADSLRRPVAARTPLLDAVCGQLRDAYAAEAGHAVPPGLAALADRINTAARRP